MFSFVAFIKLAQPNRWALKTARQWLVALTLAGTTAATASEGPVRICEDAGGWPPFVYADAEGQAKGLSIDIARILFARMGRDFSVTLLPWKRCLSEVEKGLNYDLILNASYNEDRAQRYLYTEAYYTITPHFFYDAKRFPEGIQILAPVDLKKYQVGGILGYNYSYYGLEEGDIFTSGIYNLEALIGRLKAGQFDLFVESYEVVMGHYLTTNHLSRQTELATAKIPELPPTPFYMILSKTAPGTELRDQINTILEAMKADGTLNQVIEAGLKGESSPTPSTLEP